MLLDMKEIINEIESSIINPFLDILLEERDKFLEELRDYLRTIKKDRQK